MQHSFSYHFWFVFQSQFSLPFAAFFSSATLIMEAFWFQVFHQQKKNSIQLSTSSNSKWNLIQNRYKFLAFCIISRCIIYFYSKSIWWEMCVDIMCHKVSDPKTENASTIILQRFYCYYLSLPGAGANNPQFQCTTNSLFIFYSCCCLIRISKKFLFPLLIQTINKRNHEVGGLIPF